MVPQLPRLVAMEAMFIICEVKVSNLIYYFYFMSIFINNKSKQHKMLKSDPV